MIMACLSFILTIVIFLLCRWIYRRFTYAVLNPILTSLVLLISILLFFHLPYSEYHSGAHWLSDLLQPATVAFALPLYRYFHILKKYFFEIISSVAIGSFVAVSSSMMLSQWLGIGQFANSLAPRSVTTPIAMDISKMIGGSPILTSIFVIATAMIGIITGPLLIRLLKLKSEISRGTLLGTGAHVIGTSRAFEIGHLEGTIGSISMIIAALFTLAISPMFVHILQLL